MKTSTKDVSLTVKDYFGNFHEITPHQASRLRQMYSDIENLENSCSENMEATESDRFFRELREICSPVEEQFEEEFNSTFLFSH